MPTTTPLSKEELELRNIEWDQLTDSQKVERMRDIIKNLNRTVGFLQQRLNKYESDFYQHQHDADGGITKKIKQFGDVGETGVGMGNGPLHSTPNYF